MVSFTIHAAMGEERDAARYSLAVKAPQPLTTVAAAGVLKQGGEFHLPVRLVQGNARRLDPRSRLDVILAASPVAGLSLTTDAVLDYPWGCLEQRLSKAWVRALRLDRGSTLGLAADPQDLDVLRAVIASIPDFQKSGGTFSLWTGMGETHPYLTVYTLLINAQTRNLGVSLGRATEEKAALYLQQVLGRNIMAETPGEAPGLGFVPDTEALAVWALAEHLPEEAVRLFPRMFSRLDDKSRRSPLVMGALLLAVHKLDRLDNRDDYIAKILKRLDDYKALTPTEIHFARKDSRYHWHTMGSQLRDNAVILAALSRVRPDYPQLEGLVLWVTRGIADRGVWLSTQEGAFGIWGLSEYVCRLGTGGPVEISAAWNGVDGITRRFASPTEPPYHWSLGPDALGEGVLSGKGGDPALSLRAVEGTPHWTARLAFAAPDMPVKGENRGFAVDRIWSVPKEDTSSEIAPAREAAASAGSGEGRSRVWKMGDIAEVALTVRVDENRRHVLVFDPFPAGFEPLHATRADLMSSHEKRYQFPWEWEDVRSDGMLLYKRDLAPGVYTYTYKLRAAAPGLFVHRATRAEEMYTPEVSGRTSLSTVEVRE